ncbi:biotin/lipoyl-binding protein [Paenibacillus sp. BSR1-1]|uniref:acetyl-CoA carboxylase biotin carboxyl carrier protein n=1 Tax=Paenibacillus sp. BSR1-1 TaxID=3020845 RepID=UPI0025AF4960|nr:biotin/lipoyl-containing protein [Paenibacillus sp. BSR1-1]MDN3015444.1 biotin/lipoyl-binding protein [Paenibacillus sp. BSR1-1]
MVKMLELREMIKLIDRSSIQELTLMNGGVRILMRKPLPKVTEYLQEVQTALNEAAVAVENADPPRMPAEPAVKEEEKDYSLHTIVSSCIGVFSFTGIEPIKAGDKIQSNSVVGSCKVEELKLFQDITSNINGIVVEVLVKEGQVVDYGEPLLIVKPE